MPLPKKRNKLERRDGFETMKLIFALIAIIIYVVIPVGLAFELSPENPKPGQEVTLTGTGKPGEELSFRSSFTMNLPVTGGEYGYETTVQVPQKPNHFTVSANNVQDFYAGVKFGIWITKSFQVSGGTIRISQADVPPGRYNLKMFGKALPGSTKVPVNIEAQTQVKADPAGTYKLAIDTTGIPAGDYRIQGAGDVKTIRLGGGSASASPSTDAGDICREKDIILKGGQPSQQESGSETGLPLLSGNQNSSQSGRPEPGSSFLSTVANWIRGLLGMLLLRL
jgi:hypothetical protein